MRGDRYGPQSAMYRLRYLGTLHAGERAPRCIRPSVRAVVEDDPWQESGAGCLISRWDRNIQRQPGFCTMACSRA